MSIAVEIDRKKCTGCGLCCDACLVDRIELENDKAKVTGTLCIACGHCEAACPTGAISIPILNKDSVGLTTINPDHKWIPYGEFDAAALVSLMSSRRSCRDFTEKPVDREILEDLARIGITAPSGTNSQGWTFTLLPTRGAVTSLMNEMQRFYDRLNKLARISFLRFLSRLSDGMLDTYHERYLDSVEKVLQNWKESGSDGLFYGAPAIILISSQPGASTPVEDSMLATQNILLAAHAMGLGTCLNGFAVAAMKRDKSIQGRMGIPKNEDVLAAIALGYTDQTFCRPAGRKEIKIRYV